MGTIAGLFGVALAGVSAGWNVLEPLVWSAFSLFSGRLPGVSARDLITPTLSLTAVLAFGYWAQGRLEAISQSHEIAEDWLWSA